MINTQNMSDIKERGRNLNVAAVCERARQIADCLSQGKYSSRSTIALLEDAIGLLRGIESGVINTSQPRIATSLIQAYTDLGNGSLGGAAYSTEDSKIIALAIRDVGASGLSAENMVFKTRSYSRA